MASTKSQWAELDELLLALNKKKKKKCFTYHLTVTSKFNHKRKGWNRITKITKFDIKSGKAVVVEFITLMTILDGIKYATDQMKQMN